MSVRVLCGYIKFLEGVGRIFLTTSRQSNGILEAQEGPPLLALTAAQSSMFSGLKFALTKPHDHRSPALLLLLHRPS